MSRLTPIKLVGIDQPLEVMQGDSVNLQIRVKRENGNPADLSAAIIKFVLAYTEDSWDKPIFEAEIDDGNLTWVDLPLCVFGIYIPSEALEDLKFPLKQPKRLICKYKITYSIEGFTVSKVSRTLFFSDFIINRK